MKIKLQKTLLALVFSFGLLTLSNQASAWGGVYVGSGYGGYYSSYGYGYNRGCGCGCYKPVCRPACVRCKWVRSCGPCGYVRHRVCWSY